MKKYKNILLIIFGIFILIILIIFGIKNIINNEISRQILKIEVSLEYKQFLENQKLKEDINNLSSILNSLSSSGQIYIQKRKITNKEKVQLEILKKASKTGNIKICKNIYDNKLQLSCINSLYYSEALMKLNKQTCDKIKNNDYDKNECIRKINKIINK